ncbi:beta strand repeat-containing protein [Paracidovorax sp. MALMAid1276]|uniref:beta strand repeat-containing protein n=1 Tax=Paracidovorax sp. MALMAid1276 TaxID=3411631 RepID=UPI003B9D2716
MAANYAVQDAGAGGACQNAWPPSIVGNYVENGTYNGAPRYDGSGWYLYRTSIFGGSVWAISNTLGSSDPNNSTIAFYADSSAATPPEGTGYSSTNSACGRINVQANAVVAPPSAPTIGPLNAGVAPYVSGGSTTVYWQAVAGVVGYKLDVATDAAFTTFHPGYNGLVVTASPTPPTSAAVHNLTSAGTTYYFRVKAYNGGGDSAPSDTVTTTTVPAAPDMEPFSAVRAQRVTAHWTARNGATDYRLQACTDAGFTSCLAGYNPVSVGDTASAVVSGLAQNTTYHVRVAAGNANGYSAYSAGGAVTTNALPTLGGSFTTAGAVDDNATMAPFSGVTVADANGDLVLVRITYTAANGTLSGNGLSGSAGSYTLAADTPASVTARLQALVFHPTYGQGPTGSTVTTTFTLQPNDGIDDGASNSDTRVTTTMTNVVPAFVGSTTALTVNADSGATDLRLLLRVSDTDASQTLTWSAQTAPAHGTLQLVATATPSGSNDITSVGTITYAPAPGYGGSDSFTVRVSDGHATAQRTISVTVQPVAPAAPTMVTATAGPAQASVTFSAPASNGGSAILHYTATASPGGATGSCAGPAACVITVSGLDNGTAYTFTVTATTAAGTGPASAASNSVTPKAAQTITFTNPGAQSFGTSPTLTASSSAGLAVSLSSSTPGVCAIDGAGVLSFATAGTCTIHANQPGDATHAAAATVSHSFTVNAVAPGAPTIGTATAGDAQALVAFTAPASNGGSTITGYTVTTTPPDVIPVTGTASPIAVAGLTNGVSYTFAVVAINVAGTGPASVASNSVTPKAGQTITFANPGTQSFGTTPTLSASADSLLPVRFTSGTPLVCTVSTSGDLAFVTTGTCTIHADQAGNAVFLAATQVSRSFTVAGAVPGAPTAVVATPGNAQVTVAFAAPASNGGSAILNYTVTASPGGATATGAASPLVVTGLTNGTAYTLTVTATNGAGTGPGASATATPVVTTTSGTTPGMTGTATATLSGGGSGCSLEPGSQFAGLPTAAPPGVVMAYGAFKYDASGCSGSVTMTLTYPEALPANVEFWKYGPATAGAGVSTWFRWSGATLSADRKTVSYTITDNGVGDADPAVGRVSDPFAPALGPAGGAAGIPVDAPWALGLLSAALAALGWRRQRRAVRPGGAG